MPNNNHRVNFQDDLSEYWRKMVSEEHRNEMITNERRWALWLSVKLEALVENGFSRAEAMSMIYALLSKTDPFLNLNVAVRVQDVNDHGL
jgi:hypothetical protein